MENSSFEIARKEDKDIDFPDIPEILDWQALYGANSIVPSKGM